MVKQAIGILAIALALPGFAQSIETVQLDPDVAAKLTTATITLRGDVKTDTAYNVLCERAGLDVIFDPRFEPQKMWVDFRAVKLRDALELVGRQLHTAWHVVAPNKIVVFPVQSPRPNPRKMSDPLKQTQTDKTA